MQKWEYCAVVGLYWSGSSRDPSVNHPAVWEFMADGLHIVEITRGRKEELPDLARRIARLGEEGWEMVGQNNIGELWFKRPIPETAAGTGGSGS